MRCYKFAEFDKDIWPMVYFLWQCDTSYLGLYINKPMEEVLAEKLVHNSFEKTLTIRIKSWLICQAECLNLLYGSWWDARLEVSTRKHQR